MTKTERLNALFAEWQAGEAFVRDGIIFEEKYESLQILYVLRDAHVAEGSAPPYDLRKDLVEHPQGEGRTWNNVARWTKALLDESDYADADTITPDDLSTQMSRVAIVNLKKTSGTAHANSKEISDSAKKNNDNIRKEILICEPNIIIACGTFDALMDNICTSFCSRDRINLRLSRGRVIDAEIDGFHVPVVEYRHPAQGCSAEKSFLDMKDIKKRYLLHR